jgi:hypothetical protein
MSLKSLKNNIDGKMFQFFQKIKGLLIKGFYRVLLLPCQSKASLFADLDHGGDGYFHVSKNCSPIRPLTKNYHKNLSYSGFKNKYFSFFFLFCCCFSANHTAFSRAFFSLFFKNKPFLRLNTPSTKCVREFSFTDSGSLTGGESYFRPL